MNTAAFAINLAAAAGAALVVLLAAFTIGVRTGRHRGVDVAWGLAFTAVVWTTWALSAGHGDPGRRLLVAVLVTVWGLRLSGHIWSRSRGHGEDPRYERMLAKAPPGRRSAYALRTVYLLQAVIVWFVSLPVQAAQYLAAPLGPLALAALALWGVGMFFETVGDWQLARFKADAVNRGKVMDRGLWAWTRHPNYFGDACVWWGLFLLAAGDPVGWAFVLSPVLMTYLLAFGSGKPLLERGLGSSKPGWDAYVASTSGFLPRPPRR
ncbi:DUF1295 domain-containing protein [Kitasatospora sp. NPDC094016]|uniref:DUF1295 domain-containing protein n=1 Tax=Kitasatospora sp. NPDC094016 TaxID=3154986 RepID=UPI00332400DE